MKPDRSDLDWVRDAMAVDGHGLHPHDALALAREFLGVRKPAPSPPYEPMPQSERERIQRRVAELVERIKAEGRWRM